MPYPITGKDVAIAEPDKVLISGQGATALINSLIQKPAITLVELVLGGTVVDLNQISVDADGKVVIKDIAFKKAIEAKKLSIKGLDDPSFFDTNCSCHKD